MGADERVLGDFLGIRMVVQDLLGEGEDTRIIARDDLREGGFVAGLEALGQRRIMGGGEAFLAAGLARVGALIRDWLAFEDREGGGGHFHGALCVGRKGELCPSL